MYIYRYICMYVLNMYLYTYIHVIYAHACLYICIYVTGMKFGIRKGRYCLGVMISAPMPADMQMNYGISFVHAQWFSHWKGTADNCDIIKWYHSDLLCYLGREVYKESMHEPRGCHLGFWYWTVWSIEKSPTLYSSYISASHGARV